MAESTGTAGSVVQYFRDTRAELRKVVWPTQEQALNLTVVVLFVVGLMTVILGGIDYVFTVALNVVMRLATG